MIVPILTGTPAEDDPVAPAQARMARKIIVERTSGWIESATPSLLPGTDDQGRRSAKRIP
jgi:hypothetical protein